MQTIEREIDGPADFELGRPRTAPLAYTASFPDGPAKGLVFLIPGFGDDTADGYAAALRRHVVEDHAMAAVSVRYHCYGSRPATGAKIEIDGRDIVTLLGLAMRNGVKIGDQQDVIDIAKRLHAGGVAAQARGTLKPARGEYQNFGVIQAMDHLAVLGDLIVQGHDFDRSRIVALGSSHGGYIAHMMAKIAPRTLALVIDNSSYTKPPIDYLGTPTSVEYRAPLSGQVMAFLRLESAWSYLDRSAPNFYDLDRDLIRDMAYPVHIGASRETAGATATIFRMVNSSVDTTSPPDDKRRQVAALRALGFDAQLSIIEEEHLDGRIFKTLDHGLNASLAGLFDMAIDGLEPRDGDLDGAAGTVVSFEGVDKVYTFAHSAQAPYVAGQVTSRFFD